MAKEILVYGSIHSHSTIDMLNAMDEVGPDEEMILRINTDGGQPQDGFGLSAKLFEHSGPKSAHVDGRAYSTGLFLLCFSENNTALNVSSFMVHRASMGAWFEGSEHFTPEVKGNLVSINKDLEKHFRNKIDHKKFEQLKGVKIKDIFDVDQPVKDVFFTAIEAKKIGLINKIINITPASQKRINASMVTIAAQYTGGSVHEEITEPVVPVSDDNTNSKNKKTMDKVQLLADHPALYAEILALGAEKEGERVGAWMVNFHIDAKAVQAGIDSGADFTQKDMAEFGQKQITAVAKGQLGAESADDLNTDTDNIDNGEGGEGGEGGKGGKGGSHASKVEAELMSSLGLAK